MLLRQVTGPVSFAITLTEAKAHGIIETTDDDAIVQEYLEAASRTVGEMAGRVLTEETWSVSFPTGQVEDVILPKNPVQSITSITYYDADDAEQSATVADFYLIKDDDRALVRPKAGKSWPSANQHRDDAITITFVAGYSECPKTLKVAVMAMVKHLYENRVAVSKDQMVEVPFGISALVGMEKLGWVGS